ncbi:hypothetical protein NP493_103g02053 [Ridgeia piscesae]|uniref:Uncharacterized protein n=1 Tax=Ridgeia piscesae TaxID=27915 RepID=A0AAD9P7J9_RIDPI|nr:hypothetical protein NP493_103g02053 [Ridgeia piscesae]
MTTLIETIEPTTADIDRSAILDKLPQTYVSTSSTDAVPIIAACVFAVVTILIIISVILLVEWRKDQLAIQRKEADQEIRPHPANQRHQAKEPEIESPEDNEPPQVHYVTSVIVDDTAI